MYLLWGALSLGQNSTPPTPTQCGFQVKSCFNFWDMLVTGITGGIFGMRTVKVLVFKDSPCDPKIQKMERKIEKKEMEEIKENRK
ncbi:MAG: hypothetical protein ACHQIM_21210 [Sphingobacteriales bacterium]